MTKSVASVASTSPYRPDIDGLRAVATLGVIAYHVGLPVTPGAYSGVDVFFVVSGFLITQLLVSEYARITTISLSHFLRTPRPPAPAGALPRRLHRPAPRFRTAAIPQRQGSTRAVSNFCAPLRCQPLLSPRSRQFLSARLRANAAAA